MMSFMSKLFGSKPKNANEAFWQWFITHSAELLKVTDCRERICTELDTQMRKVHQGLVFAFGPEEDGKREFIVSADGIKAVFPAVQSLVNSAPDTPDSHNLTCKPRPKSY